MSIKFPDHWIEYGLLCELMKTYELYGMVVEELYEVKSVMEHFSEVNILSNGTLKAAQLFQDKWYQILSSKPYGKDRIFVYLDIEFQQMLDNELFTFLNLLNVDLAKIKFPNIEDINEVDRKFPDTLEILERASSMYEYIAHLELK